MSDEFDGNIILLTADSLRADYYQDAMADLADITDGTVFTEAVATAPFTLSAMPSLAAGVYGDTAGIGLNDQGPPIPLAEVFEDRGYTNCLISDNYLFGAEYNYQRGFHLGDMGEPTNKKQIANILQQTSVPFVYEISKWVYFNVLKRLSGAEETFYRSAADLHAVATDHLQQAQSDSLFSWIHYMDTHHPFEPPREYLDARYLSEDRSRAEWSTFTRQAIMDNGATLSETELSDLKELYQASCEFFADELMAYVQDLMQSGLYSPDRDMLVVTADHGEGLTKGKHGTMGHTPATYWEEVVRVPLLIAHPKWDSRVVDRQVSLIDLMPTILDLADCPIPDGVEGQPASELLDLPRENAYFVGVDPIGSIESVDSVAVTRGIRTSSGEKFFGNRRPDGEDTYVYSSVTDGHEEVLFETADPEDANAPSQMVTLQEKLRENRGEALEKIRVDELESEMLEGSDMEAHLRDLGYIE